MSNTTEALFPASLIPATTTASFPEGFHVRPLEKGDYAKGFLDCLRVLTHVGDVTEAEFAERFDDMKATKGTYYFLVVEHQGRIVGTGVLVVEKKFIHDRGIAGHIEEVSVQSELQGKGLGRLLVQAITAVAAAVGCYRCTLNCSPKNEPFYVKCGYQGGGSEMAIYFEEEKDSYHRG